MDPLKTYDDLTIARGRIFDALRPLTAERYAQHFPIGPGTLARTLTHILISEWYDIERLLRREVPPYPQWKIRDENPLPFAALEATWLEQAAPRGRRCAACAIGRRSSTTASPPTRAGASS
jgi:uncharacterized damage-inducible protein DinB